MKKLISFIILLALCISLFGCAKAPVTDPIDESMYKPLQFELSDEFQPYEVVVTLTKQESEKGKNYSLKDFREVDAFHIFEYNEYYKNYDEELMQGRRTFVLMLNEPSKENVLKYCEILEKDSRVSFARPNINPYAYKIDKLLVTLKDDVKYIYPTDFKGVDLRSAYSGLPLYKGSAVDVRDGVICVEFNYRYSDDYNAEAETYAELVEYMTKQIKKLSKDSKVKHVRPVYDFVDERSVWFFDPDPEKEYTVSDFDYLEINDIKTNAYGTTKLFLKKPDKKTVVDAKRLLANKGFAKNVGFNSDYEFSPPILTYSYLIFFEK